MARISIETYRGWDIGFDTEKETFTAICDPSDEQKEKKSFAAVKKAVDEYIKENGQFKPFWIECTPNGYSKMGRQLYVVGIRKDGRFVVRNMEGSEGQLSEYDEKDYAVIGDAEQNAAYWQELDNLIRESSKISSKITAHKRLYEASGSLADKKREILAAN